MIKSYKHKGLKAYWTKGNARGLNPSWLSRIDNIISALDAATRPEDLNLPGLRFHPLQGVSRYSVSLTGNFRVTFGWRSGHPVDVDIEDYH